MVNIRTKLKPNMVDIDTIVEHSLQNNSSFQGFKH